MATLFGKGWAYNSAKWGADSYYLEAYMASSNGAAATMELYGDVSGVVTGSSLTTSSTSFSLVRSSAMTLVNGNVYRARVTSSGNCAILAVRIVALSP